MTDVMRAEQFETELLAELWDIEERLHRIRERFHAEHLAGQSNLMDQFVFDSARLSVAQDIVDDFIKGSPEYDARRKQRNEERMRARLLVAIKSWRGDEAQGAASSNG